MTKNKVKISVYWPDDTKSIILSRTQYQLILDGNSFSEFGEGFYYEGESFSDYWIFEGGEDSNITVHYDDGGIGFEGTLSECEIEEF